jgi:hypothetical protein
VHAWFLALRYEKLEAWLWSAREGGGRAFITRSGVCVAIALIVPVFFLLVVAIS